jgi:hypothetical protein
MDEAAGESPVAAAAAAGGVWGGSADSGGVAVVVDAETTSYLMMGALSPGESHIRYNAGMTGLQRKAWALYRLPAHAVVSNAS